MSYSKKSAPILGVQKGDSMTYQGPKESHVVFQKIISDHRCLERRRYDITILTSCLNLGVILISPTEWDFNRHGNLIMFR